MKEHQRATRKGYYLESGVAEHVMDTGHNIDWSAKILDQDLHQRRRLIREAVCIRKENPSMNRDQGVELSRAYSSLLQKDGNTNMPSRGGNH